MRIYKNQFYVTLVAQSSSSQSCIPVVQDAFKSTSEWFKTVNARVLIRIYVQFIFLLKTLKKKISIKTIQNFDASTCLKNIISHVKLKFWVAHFPM